MSHTIPRQRFALILSSTLALLVACGDDDSHSHADAAADCSAETRDDDYAAGIVKVGENGYKVVLVDSLPSPPAKGDNDWTVQILDSSDVPMDNVELTVTPFMPDHGHGTPLKAEVTPSGNAGEYTVTPVNLWMPGLWEITFEISDGDNVLDTVVFAFCING